MFSNVFAHTFCIILFVTSLRNFSQKNKKSESKDLQTDKDLCVVVFLWRSLISLSLSQVLASSVSIVVDVNCSAEHSGLSLPWHKILLDSKKVSPPTMNSITCEILIKAASERRQSNVHEKVEIKVSHGQEKSFYFDTLATWLTKSSRSYFVQWLCRRCLLRCEL